MASWREIDRIRKDPVAVRRIAKSLLALPAGELSDWEIEFLEKMAVHTGEEDLSTRQSEKLLEIRDDSEVLTKCGENFSVGILIQRCYEARIDLAEGDEEWITKIRQQCSVSIKRKFVGRLLRCARELHFIDGYVEA